MSKQSKVVALSASGHTPAVVMNRTTEKLDKLRTVLVLMRWRDEHGGGWSIDWSMMSVGDMAFAHAALGVKLQGNMVEAYDPEADHFVDPPDIGSDPPDAK